MIGHSAVLISALALVVLLITGGAYFGLANRQAPPSSGSQSTPRTATTERPEIPVTSTEPAAVSTPIGSPTQVVELPALYPGIQWELTKCDRFKSVERSQQAICIQSPVVGEADLKDFLSYYEQQFTPNRWTAIEAIAGPGGSSSGYESNGRYIRVGYRHVFQGQATEQMVVGYRLFIEHN